MTKKIWIMFVVYIMAKDVISDLSGPNVCQEEERYKVNITKYVLRNVTVRSYQWCLQVPPRCSTYAVQQINDTKLEEKVETRSNSKCCDGYYETNEETCLPNSCKFCRHGQCDESGACNCESGYWGANCERECTSDEWRDNCRRVCTNCTEGPCNVSTRNCTICPPKFIRCELICFEGHNYNKECLEDCRCDNLTACGPLINECQTVKYNNRSAIENDDFLNSILVKRNSSDDNKHLQVLNLPDITAATLQDVENINLNYVTTEPYSDVDKRMTFTSVITEINEKESISKTKEHALISQNIIESTEGMFTEKSTNFTLKLSESPEYDNNILDSDKFVGVNSIPDESKTKERHALRATNHTSDNLVMDSYLFTTIVSAGLFSVLIIISAAVICVLHKLKVKKKKYIEAVRISVDNGKENIKMTESVPSLSVTTRSIFHTPLPDPPTFENPAFVTQFEGAQTKQPGILETHVICNVNIPKITKHDQPKQDNPDFFYDHPPPSTGKHRLASSPEPPNLNYVKSNFDPIYDEIPCHQRIVPAVSPTLTHEKEQVVLYMNT